MESSRVHGTADHAPRLQNARKPPLPWLTKQGYSSKDSEFDLIYVNGSNNLENIKTPDDTWKVRLIEEDFHRLMFDTEGA